MQRSLFLTDEELAILTGRKLKGAQIVELRRMMIPFHINALGKPVVTVVAVTGTGASREPESPKKWTPHCLAT
jgi:hypothetical protein